MRLSQLLEILMPRLQPHPQVKTLSPSDQQSFVSIYYNIHTFYNHTYVHACTCMFTSCTDVYVWLCWFQTSHFVSYRLLIMTKAFPVVCYWHSTWLQIQCFLNCVCTNISHAHHMHIDDLYGNR